MNHTFDLISSSLLCFSALIGFVYGLIRFFRPGQALYKKMVACAIGCLFIERLYGIVQILVAGDVTQLFQIGTFGNIGCYMFLFSANYGAIDKLIDDGSAELKKYRQIALAAPAVAIGIGVVLLLSPSDPGRTITCAIEELFTGASAYYSLKHLLIPKKYMDFLSSLKPFHALCLLLAVGLTTENIIWCYQITTEVVWAVPYTLLLFVMPATAPVLERGIKKWRA